MSTCWLHLCSLYTAAKTDGEWLLTHGQGKEHLQALAVTPLNADEERTVPIFHKVLLPAIRLILLSRTSKPQGNEAPPGNNVKKAFGESLSRCWSILTAALLCVHGTGRSCLRPPHKGSFWQPQPRESLRPKATRKHNVRNNVGTEPSCKAQP